MVNGVITWPISFSATDYIVSALKNNDHGGAIPNLLSTELNQARIEYEWVTYYGGLSEQHTLAPNDTHAIAIGH